MARDPNKIEDLGNSITTAKIKVRIYNKLVGLRREKESISELIERLIDFYKGRGKKS